MREHSPTGIPDLKAFAFQQGRLRARQLAPVHNAQTSLTQKQVQGRGVARRQKAPRIFCACMPMPYCVKLAFFCKNI